VLHCPDGDSFIDDDQQVEPSLERHKENFGRVAMLITGHKTEHMYERYNIKNTDDVKEALIKVGHFKRASVTPIADLATSR
jgi:hypothetical protein